MPVAPIVAGDDGIRLDGCHGPLDGQPQDRTEEVDTSRQLAGNLNPLLGPPLALPLTLALPLSGEWRDL